MSFSVIDQNEDWQMVILMLLSCKLYGNQFYLQLSVNSHRVWLQFLSVARLNISFNCCNWWWNIIDSESFLLLYRSFWMDILDRYVYGILSFSEDYHQLFLILPPVSHKGEDRAYVLFMGLALARGPIEHPWLMSLALTNGAMRCQCTQKHKTSQGEKITSGRKRNMVCM